MQPKISMRSLLLLAVLAAVFFPPARTIVFQPKTVAAQSIQASEATPGDLIVAMNTLRVSNGYPALIEDAIIDAVAQGTAEYMAANEMTWHIGNASGRIQAAGYGGGAKVWATENFSSGFTALDDIMQVWSDPSHMLPAVTPAYCNIGAGSARSPNGMMYYVLQAAYVAGKSCGTYSSGGGGSGGATPKPGSVSPGVSQIIIPVKVATPDADGKIYHVVQAGQSFWSIAVAYKITIKDIEFYNNISRDTKLQVGQKLFIPSSSTTGYATPTQVGMVQKSTPDQDGKIVHEVQAYQNLSTIADAYGIKVDTILALNAIQIDWPLQIGQKLIIQGSLVTPSATLRPLTPLEKLTPASDGKYYHIIKNGETLLWIAGLYGVKLADLLSWNQLTETSVIRPDEKLLLQVTPPATQTYTPGPATATLPPTRTLTKAPPTRTATASPTLAPTAAAIVPSPTAGAAPSSASTAVFWVVPVALAGGVLMVVYFIRKKR
jgi:LysM repeat protein/uncharacterized protein YkwD